MNKPQPTDKQKPVFGKYKEKESEEVDKGRKTWTRGKISTSSRADRLAVETGFSPNDVTFPTNAWKR